MDDYAHIPHLWLGAFLKNELHQHLQAISSLLQLITVLIKFLKGKKFPKSTGSQGLLVLCI